MCRRTPAKCRFGAFQRVFSKGISCLGAQSDGISFSLCQPQISSLLSDFWGIGYDLLHMVENNTSAVLKWIRFCVSFCRVARTHLVVWPKNSFWSLLKLFSFLFVFFFNWNLTQLLALLLFFRNIFWTLKLLWVCIDLWRVCM